MKVLTITLYFFASIICFASSARILGIFHMAAYSHYQLGDTILKELVANGHEVTVITPYTEKKPIKNFKQVILTGAIEEIERMKEDFVKQGGKHNILQTIFSMGTMTVYFTESTLNHTNVQKLLKSNEQFDLVIMEQFLNEAFKGFCHKYKAPCVVLSTFGGSQWTNPQMGNPEPPSYVPNTFLGLSSKMNFCERLYNSLIYLAATLFTHLYLFPKQNEVLHRYFPNAPHLDDLYYNTPLILLNSHVSINPALPYVPNMIEIGGFHVKPPKKLPEDLQNYLDNSKEGVIYFSMGSNIPSKYLPKAKLDILLKAFSKLKQKVLWKWEDETLPGQPPNVKISRWLPQQDILAHSNIKLFITHGGLLSMIETIYHGVPIVGIPLFADQKLNLANAETAGYGIGVSYDSLTEDAFSSAIADVLNNPKYTENVKTRSKIMHDQPMKPLDRAIFWIEYVLRHQGAPHLRSAALNLNWYQYLLLDVVAVVALALLTSVYVIYKIIKFCCCRKSPKKVSKEKKRN